MTSSTVTIHHSLLGKRVTRAITYQKNPVTAPHSLTGRSAQRRVGGGFAKKERKKWWTKGWQSHYYLLFLLAQTNDSLVLIETLLSVALVFLQQRKKKTKTCSPWRNLSDETNVSMHTIHPLKVIQVNKKYNWCHPGVENRILTSSRVKSSFTINVAFKSCRGIMNKFNY